MAALSQDFDQFLQRRIDASNAFVSGDFKPLEQLSTHASPATIFGPQGNILEGPDKINASNEKATQQFLPGSTNSFEILHKAADEHLAYLVGVQRSAAKLQGQPDPIIFNLRVTEIFRREDGEWKLIHRHADKLAESNA